MGRKQLWIPLVAYCIYLIFITLSPFRLRPLERHYLPWPIGHFRSDLIDVILNVFLFVPFGFIVAFIFKKTIGRGPCVYAILMAAGVSLGIETLQIIMHGRFPSFIDILTNTLGGGIGFLIGNALKHRYNAFPQGSALRLQPRIQKMFIGLAGLYAAFLCYLPFAAGEPFEEWGSDVQLMIGARPDKTAPWQGEILSLAIYNQALTRDQIIRHYQEGPTEAAGSALQLDPLALYDFAPPLGALVLDGAFIKPPSDLLISPLPFEPSDPVFFGKKPPLEDHGLILDGSIFLVNPTGGSKLTESIRRTKQLTVEGWIHAQPQTGEGGRWVSFVQGGRALWYLHQERDEIVLGIRKGFFQWGRFHSEGVQTFLSQPSQKPVHLVGVYNPEQAFIYLNGKQVAKGILSNGFFILSNFLNLDRMTFGGRGCLGLLLFWPFGLLISLSHSRSYFAIPLTAGLLGGALIAFLLVLDAQHSVSFFTLRTAGVPFMAFIFGGMSGEEIKRYLFTPPLAQSPR